MTEARHHRSRTRLEPAVRRRQIVEAAARVFAEHDTSTVSFERIAHGADVSRSLVYVSFGDRDSLFAAAYNHELEVLDAELDGALASLGSDRERLAGVVSAYLAFAWRHRQRWQFVASASSVIWDGVSSIAGQPRDAGQGRGSRRSRSAGRGADHGAGDRPRA